MDLNPKSFPILSYAMSKMPYLNGESRFDIERPRSTSEASTSTSPSFDLTEQMPLLSDPKVISSMQSTVCQVAQTRSALQLLGERPDHESVDIAKAKLAEIDSKLSKQLEEVVMTPRATIVDQHGWRLQLAKKEEEYRQAAEKEKQVYKAVITLDGMHESYEKLLKDAEEKLVKIYESAGAREESEDDQPVAEEVNEEVVRILQEASGKGNERIDLSGRRLRFLPEAFGRLPGLVALNLSTNQLEVIPDSISMLERLEELNLSANLLDSLPDSIGLLVNLKILNVSGNQLNTLPDSICHCRSLVEFDASFNRLTYLPTNIGHELVNLKKLAISLNKIRSLPTSIGEMSSLCILDVRFNELNGIPLTIGKLMNLEILNLSSNFSDLTELPDTIGDLTNLRELDLSNNQIQALPVTFGRLENLTRLNLDANPLVIPPTEVVNGGVEAVRVYMAKRLVDMLMEEEQMMNVVKEQMESDWLTRSTSWLNDVVSGVSGSVFGYLGALGKSSIDPSLDQQL